MTKKMQWKELLKKHDALRRNGNANVYDRVKLLSQIFNDPGYNADMLKQGKDKRELLDACLDELCINITEALVILKMFPRREQWVGGSLREMKLRTIQMIQSKQKAETGKKKKIKVKFAKNTVTLAQYNKLLEENHQLKEKIRHLESELEIAKLALDRIGINARKVG